MSSHTTILLAALACGCATEEEVTFGAPGRVGGGFSSGASTTGGACEINGACTVSWSNTIYPTIIDGPLDGEVPSGGCSETQCHQEGAGGLRIEKDNPDQAYTAIVPYELVGARQYIAPCHPELSHIMCNIKTADGVDNEFIGPDRLFTGGCGSLMPKLDEDVKGTAPLNQVQLDSIAEWILCGAPQN